MKNTSKSFSKTFRQYFRESMVLYAAATANYPNTLDLLKMAQQSGSEE